MDKATIAKIFAAFEKHNPLPKIELNYTTPFELLIAVILSAQSTDKAVNIVTRSLFEVANTPEEILSLGEEGLKSYIKTLGLFNNKAKSIIALSKKIIEDFKGQVPQTLSELESLPGVGRKSANVMLNCIYGQHTIAVDTHVFRVSNRIGLCHTKNPLQTELMLLKIVPAQYLDRAHHWLVLHGRYVCKARKPECFRCILVEWCEYPDKNL